MTVGRSAAGMVVSVPTFDEVDRPRHAWLETFCGHLHSMILGKWDPPAAADGPLVLLPSWVWLVPQVNAGRKGKDNLLPARVNWFGQQVVQAGQDGRRLKWKLEGLGHHQQGELLLEYDPSLGTPVIEADGNSPIPARMVVGRRGDTIQGDGPECGVEQVEALRLAGVEARWRASQQLEESALRAVQEVATSISADVWEHQRLLQGAAGTAGGPPPLLDPIEIEQVRDQLFLRPGKISGRPAVHRLLDKALEPATFRSVDPLRYMATNLKRDAWDAVRRHIGEPRAAGPRLRTVFRETSPQDVAQLLTNYKQAYPQQATPSFAAGANALTLGNTANVGTVQHREAQRAPSARAFEFEDAAVLRADLASILGASPFRAMLRKLSFPDLVEDLLHTSALKTDHPLPHRQLSSSGTAAEREAARALERVARRLREDGAQLTGKQVLEVLLDHVDTAAETTLKIGPNPGPSAGPNPGPSAGSGVPGMHEHAGAGLRMPT